MLYGNDWLYQLTPKDREVTPLVLTCDVHTPFGRSEVSANMFDFYRVLQGYSTLWWLHAFSFRASGGGAQTVSRVIVKTVSNVVAGNEFVIFDRNYATAIAGEQIVLPYPLPFDNRQHLGLSIEAQFSAGAVANSLLTGVHAVLQPTGNIAVGSLRREIF